MKKYLHAASVLAVAVVAIAVAYYFIIFLPSLRLQQDAASNQAGCLQMEQGLLTEIRQQADQSNRVYGIITGATDAYAPIKAHYNTAMQKCFVEVDDYFMSSGFMGNDYAIYDASEDYEIADCNITSWMPTNYAAATTTTQCGSGSISIMATSTTISPSEFQTLENRYMNE